MVRISDTFKAVGLSLALLLPATTLPAVSHAQQTDTMLVKAKTKRKARKTTAPATTPSPAEGTTQRNPPAGTPDPINPSSSPEPPTPTTQGPPPVPTTPSTNAPLNPPGSAPQNAPH